MSTPTPDVSLREKAKRAGVESWFNQTDHIRARAGFVTADFITAASPEVIIALLDRVERAEADSKRIGEYVAEYVVQGISDMPYNMPEEFDAETMIACTTSELANFIANAFVSFGESAPTPEVPPHG